MPSRLKFTDKDVSCFHFADKSRPAGGARRENAAEYRQPLRLLRSILGGRRRHSFARLVVALQEGR